MTFLRRYRYYIIGGVLFCALLGGWFSIQPNKKITVASSTYLNPKQEEEGTTLKEERLTIDIKGAVLSPGVYTLPEGKRVMDAILEAGGLLENADTSVLNLSLRLEDAMVIVVYTNEQVASFVLVKEKEEQEKASCLHPNASSLENDACRTETDSITKTPSKENNGKISLNQGSLEELMTLPGIGESKARAILTYRVEKGSFQSIEELMEVKGIGVSIFAKIKDRLTL